MKTMRKILAAALAFVLLGLPVSAKTPEKVEVGGMPFGVRFTAEGVVIIGFSEVETASGAVNPAYDAGLRVNDVIIEVNGEAVASAEEMLAIIENSDKSLSVTYLREGQEGSATLLPVESAKDGRRRAGMWVRDTMAGIGTVTYFFRETGEFAGLGHGICDTQTGELVPMEEGKVTDVMITGVEKGAPGCPGELRGAFTGGVCGVLKANTACGVFGVFENPPDGETVGVACRDEVHTGRASILCTVEGQKPTEYEICITEINRRSRDNRSFSVVVTDKALLEKTGGIVQGMSGSPILQDGRLVGAVTHVLVGDPAEGYGIFIENMLDAAA